MKEFPGYDLEKLLNLPIVSIYFLNELINHYNEKMNEIMKEEIEKEKEKEKLYVEGRD